MKTMHNAQQENGVAPASIAEWHFGWYCDVIRDIRMITRHASLTETEQFQFNRAQANAIGWASR